MENLGFKNLLWFMGVVEEFVDPESGAIGDPLGLYRTKVRCFGFHPFRKDEPNIGDKVLMPTADLPWAIPIMNTNFYHPPNTGDWVFGFFIDGRDAQHPMILGILPGVNTFLPNNPEDNVDAVRRYVVSPESHWLPNTPKVARGESLDASQVFDQSITVSKNIESASGRKWDQPPPAYNSQYPHNKVFESKSGHLIELDDTPGVERVHIYHKSGSKIEIDSAGTTVYKTTGSNYEIIDQNAYVKIDGKQDVTISGQQYVYIKGDCNLKVDGNYTKTVHGDYTLNVAGKTIFNTTEIFELRAAKINMETYAENMNFYSTKKIKMFSEKETSMISKDKIFVYSESEINLKADDNLYLTSDNYINMNGNNVAVEGGRIDFNPESFSVPKAIIGEMAIQTSIELPLTERKITNVPEIESTRAISIFDIDENFEG